MAPVLIVLGFICIAVVIRLFAGAIDTDRIDDYVREQGWTLLDKSWEPFAVRVSNSGGESTCLSN